MLTNKNIKTIIEILKTSYRSYEDIASQFDTDYKTISKINRGVLYKKDNEIYPIRQGKVGSTPPKFTYDEVSDIITYLQNTNFSLRKIARLFNAEYVDILNIKNGTTVLYRRRELKYPLRKNN